MNNKPTLKTLALETGLAVTTVSRALNGAPEIAENTRRKVREMADRIGYQPDRAAQRLKTGKTKVIAFILEPHEEMLSFGTRMIAGIMSAIRQTDYHLVVIPQYEDEDPIATVRNIVLNRNADGIIFCRTKPMDERVKYLLGEGFPFVTHGRTELASPHPFVDYDNFEFTLHAARKLIGEGRKKLALIGAPEAYTYSQHMLHGFMTAIRESGIAYETAYPVDISSPEADVRAWVSEAIISRSVDGIICGGESALLATLAVLAQKDLKAGEEIGIVFKQTTPLFDTVNTGVCVVHEDLELAGRKLGETLLAALEWGNGNSQREPLAKVPAAQLLLQPTLRF